MQSKDFDVSSDTVEHRRALIVVGMHRSGTSAMTRTLSLLGAKLPSQLIEPKHDNETGFWEPVTVTQLNDEILQGLDSEWDDVFAFRPKRYLSNFDQVFLGRAVELLNLEFSGSELIVLKDPRVSVLAGFWERALRQAGYETHYLVMVRNPLEVAESLRVRNGFPREKSLLLWSSYMIAADRDTRSARRTFVAFDQLLRDWRSVRRRIEEGTGAPFPRDTVAAAVEIDRYLDTRHRHHTIGVDDLFSRSDVPKQIKSLYRIFSDACDGAAVDERAVREVESELEATDLLVGPVLADLRSLVRTLGGEVGELEAARTSVSNRLEHAEAELNLLSANLETALQVNAEYKSRIAELDDRILALEVERKRVLKEAKAKDRRASRDRHALKSQMSLLEERLRRNKAATAESQAMIAERDSALEAALAKNLQAEFELENVRERLENERAVLEKTSAEELAHERQARESAEADSQVSAGKLAERFQELATLAVLLRKEEARSDEVQGQIAWLMAVNDHLSMVPRWWSLMPRRWKYLRQLQRVEEAGLFDAEAYLRRNPDVAAARADPLQHYLRHGLLERRSI